MPWPEGDEDELWHLAAAWETFGGELDTLAADLAAEANAFAQTIRGQAGDALTKLLATDMHDSAVQLKDQADAYAKMLKNAGADIEKSKIMIIGMLAILAATIAMLFASLFGSFAVPSVIAAARVGIGALLRSLLARLLEVGLVNIARELAIKAVVGGLVGAGFMVGFDSAIQGVQLAQGHRDGFDAEALKGDAIGGAIGGALGGLAEGLAGSLGRIGRDLWERLPRSVRGFAPLGSAVLQIPAAALSNPIINTATHSPGNAIDGVFGALDHGGGSRPVARVPHVDMPEIKPLGELSLNLALSLPTGHETPVVGRDGTTIGATFARPDTPRSSASSQPQVEFHEAAQLVTVSKQSVEHENVAAGVDATTSVEKPVTDVQVEAHGTTSAPHVGADGERLAQENGELPQSATSVRQVTSVAVPVVETASGSSQVTTSGGVEAAKTSTIMVSGQPQASLREATQAVVRESDAVGVNVTTSVEKPVSGANDVQVKAPAVDQVATSAPQVGTGEHVAHDNGDQPESALLVRQEVPAAVTGQPSQVSEGDDAGHTPTAVATGGGEHLAHDGGQPLAPTNWVDRARVERPSVAGAIDGSAVRESVHALLGLTDSRSDAVFRAMVEQQFSDENLAAHFARAVDGGMVVDLGPRSHSAPQIRLEVTGLGMPSSVSQGSADLASSHRREPATTNLTNARAAVLAEARAYRIPTPLVTVGVKIAGMVHARGSDLTSTSTHGGETTVVEAGVPVRESLHEATYQVTVRMPRTAPWTTGVIHTDVVSAEVPLVWSQQEPAAATSTARLERPQQIAHAELSELGAVARRVESVLGEFPVGHPGARKFRDWVQTLPASAPDLFSGKPVREMFRFPGQGRVEVSVSIADTVAANPLPAGQATIERTTATSGETSAGQSVQRRWGGGAVVMFGDVTGIVAGGAAGPTVTAYGSTKTETRVTETFRAQLSDLYSGPVDKQRVHFSYVVSVGGESAKVFTVDGAGTVWAKADENVAGPRALPATIDPSRVLDQVDAEYRLPEETLTHLIGPVLHRLTGEGIVKADRLPEIQRRFRRFLEDNARELVRGGDGVRFPLSAWHKNAPDVFVRGRPQVSEVRYLGVAEHESRSGVVAAEHRHSVEVTKGKDFDAGVAGMAYDSESTDYRQAGFSVTYKKNSRDVENIAHGAGHEQAFANGDRTLHRMRYPAEFEVRVGGRWGDPAETLTWPADDAHAESVLHGEVDVVAPEPVGLCTESGTVAADPDRPTWHEGTSPAAGGHAGYLPTGFELNALKPVPDLLGTVTGMLEAPPSSRVAGWLRRPLVGTRPAGFDEHKGAGFWGRKSDVADERNAAREVLEQFTSAPVRAGRFERAALYHDTVLLKSHNRAGLAGSRERVAQVDLAARLANPRILGVEEAHRFTGTEVAASGRSTEATTGSGVKAKVDLFEVPMLSTLVNPAVVLGGSVMRMRQDGTSGGEALQESTSRTRSERGYRVTFDATYEVRTASHRDWQDAVGFRHSGRVREETRWVSVPEAATVWVPAGEIHRVGVLSDADIAGLHPDEARRYRQEHAEETSPDEVPLLPPSDVGRGSGQVELHRLEAGTELLTQIAMRLKQWADQHAVEFAPVNERLVRDVLGPALTGSRFTPALREMLTAGRPIYLEGSTPFGKVEQLVVLRAGLGTGAYHRTVVGESVQSEATTGARSGSSKVRGWVGELFAGVVAYSSVSGQGKPGGTAGAYATATHTFQKRAELSKERTETVTAGRSGDSAEFIHDLHVTMDVYPYAGAGHYRRLLPGARELSQPWSAEFSLPGAVRSSVPMDEVIPAGASPAPPLAEVDGSLAPLGLGNDTVVRVRPFQSGHLHRTLDELANGHNGRPALQPRALHQLRSGAGSLALRSHLRELLSPAGYVIKVAGDRLSQVTISAEVVKRELVRVLDEPLRSSAVEQRGAKITDAHKGEMGPTLYVSPLATYIQDSTQRPGGAIHEAFSSWKNWEYERSVDTSTTKDLTQPNESESRYLIRLTPRWQVLPAYRSAKTQAAWGEVVRTEPDTPILIETDHNGLVQLGLTEPRPARTAEISLRDFLGPRLPLVTTVSGGR